MKATVCTESILMFSYFARNAENLFSNHRNNHSWELAVLLRDRVRWLVGCVLVWFSGCTLSIIYDGVCVYLFTIQFLFHTTFLFSVSLSQFLPFLLRIFFSVSLLLSRTIFYYISVIGVKQVLLHINFIGIS